MMIHQMDTLFVLLKDDKEELEQSVFGDQLLMYTNKHTLTFFFRLRRRMTPALANSGPFCTGSHSRGQFAALQSLKALQ